MRDRRLHPGDFDGGDFAQIKTPLADIGAPSGINAACINAEAAGGKQSAGQMVALGRQRSTPPPMSSGPDIIAWWKRVDDTRLRKLNEQA